MPPRRTPAKKAPAKKAAKGVGFANGVLHVDPDDLTLGELDDFEQAVGESFEVMLRGRPVKDDDGRVVVDPRTKKPKREVQPTFKQVIALVWIAKRREDPTFTIEQARHIKLAELQIGQTPDPQ